AQCDDADVVGIEVNIRRVCERVRAEPLAERAAEEVAITIAGDELAGRNRLLALMDLGATVCTARTPRCDACPLRARCASRGAAPHEAERSRQAPFAGSFRQRRGQVLARLRADAGGVPVADLDVVALDSLVTDGLATITASRAHLPLT
ncbi:MAG TPA: A/G-specific adenine glycosylase, partial [Acidimicrobiia bacterium]|nr:A/G-specific adenine glycosylase [Acidimicrobiia bacterium]